MTKRIDRYETTVGGTVVVATRVPPGAPDVGVQAVDRGRAAFEVRVDGVRRGMLVLPHGFGKDWQAWAFGYVVRPAWDNDHARLLNGYGKAGHGDDPQALLARFAAWNDGGLVPTVEEVSAFVAQVAEDRRLREEEDARRAETSRIEEKARKARERAARAARLASLESVRDRLAASLTNEEVAALEDTMAALRSEIASDLSLEAYFAQRA